MVIYAPVLKVQALKTKKQKQKNGKGENISLHPGPDPSKKRLTKLLFIEKNLKMHILRHPPTSRPFVGRGTDRSILLISSSRLKLSFTFSEQPQRRRKSI